MLGCGAPPEAPIPAAEQEEPKPLPEMKRGLGSRSVILTYHDMVPERDGESLWFDCTPGELEEQIAWLRAEGAVFISLQDVYDALIGEASLPTGAVAITFADNYRGFLEHAWPILEREEIPVTMFVHTGFVGSRQGRPKMTWEELRELSKSPLFRAESQTVSHPEDLTQLAPRDIEHEFSQSRMELEQELARPCRFLAYPNGKFNADVADQAREAGYMAAFTEELLLAEASPSIWQVARWVHTRYRDAWKTANP